MVWEQRSRGVVMLNRVIEKGSVSLWLVVILLPGDPVCQAEVKLSLFPGANLQVKCAQYWPQREERDSVFEDTNFKLTLVSEDIKSYYTVRQLELENLSVSV